MRGIRADSALRYRVPLSPPSPGLSFSTLGSFGERLVSAHGLIEGHSVPITVTGRHSANPPCISHRARSASDTSAAPDPSRDVGCPANYTLDQPA